LLYAAVTGGVELCSNTGSLVSISGRPPSPRSFYYWITGSDTKGVVASNGYTVDATGFD